MVFIKCSYHRKEEKITSIIKKVEKKMKVYFQFFKYTIIDAYKIRKDKYIMRIVILFFGLTNTD